VADAGDTIHQITAIDHFFAERSECPSEEYFVHRGDPVKNNNGTRLECRWFSNILWCFFKLLFFIVGMKNLPDGLR
jgi:hypothetical protein